MYKRQVNTVMKAGWLKSRKTQLMRRSMKLPHWIATVPGPAWPEKKEYQKEACIAYIDEMVGKDHPEIGEILKVGIEAIQDMKVSKITVNTYIGQTARLSMGKDGIKVELERKEKEENLA